MTNSLAVMRRIALLILWMLIVTDVSLYFLNRFDVSRRESIISRIYTPKGELSRRGAPTGYTADGQKSAVTENDIRGWVVRYASKSCKFCKQDEHEWESLASSMKEKGFQPVTIVTSPNEQYPSNSPNLVGSPQIVYVDFGWISNFHLDKTPTTILSNSAGPFWVREGALKSSDISSAMRAADAH